MNLPSRLRSLVISAPIMMTALGCPASAQSLVEEPINMVVGASYLVASQWPGTGVSVDLVKNTYTRMGFAAEKAPVPKDLLVQAGGESMGDNDPLLRRMQQVEAKTTWHDIKTESDAVRFVQQSARFGVSGGVGPFSVGVDLSNEITQTTKFFEGRETRIWEASQSGNAFDLPAAAMSPAMKEMITKAKPASKEDWIALARAIRARYGNYYIKTVEFGWSVAVSASMRERGKTMSDTARSAFSAHVGVFGIRADAAIAATAAAAQKQVEAEAEFSFDARFGALMKDGKQVPLTCSSFTDASNFIADLKEGKIEHYARPIKISLYHIATLCGEHPDLQSALRSTVPPNDVESIDKKLDAVLDAVRHQAILIPAVRFDARSVGISAIGSPSHQTWASATGESNADVYYTVHSAMLAKSAFSLFVELRNNAGWNYRSAKVFVNDTEIAVLPSAYNQPPGVHTSATDTDGGYLGMRWAWFSLGRVDLNPGRNTIRVQALDSGYCPDLRHIMLYPGN